jgi:hypothetical protein
MSRQPSAGVHAEHGDADDFAGVPLLDESNTHFAIAVREQRRSARGARRQR